MALSHVEVEEEGEAKRVSCEAEVCYNLSGVVVTPDLVDGSVSPILVGTGGGMPSDSPVNVRSLGTESLVEMPIVVMSPIDLNAQFVYNLGVTCLGQSGWNDGSPSLLGKVGDDLGDE
ncbi:hypothetical protein MA16_Dca024291 [Dendrobium catenatum]|uniref:Uncharacterized protein n=1 Tax=Dendrobium catenatum TaxID=906689 RepID=A0A2I0VGF3_9ASPA|nr:hypothetical protein MA16_Dca024291 [Dendrobium catenatum]